MIKIICVGQLKETYLKDAVKEYIKRISKYTKVNLIEVNDMNNGEILKKEKEEIFKYIDSKDYIVTLDIEGKEMDSITFAKTIDNIFIYNSNITFIIGGSYGLDDEIKKISNLRLSFSKMTFPHQLFRVMLLEQVYRAFKINHNEEYHK